MKRIQRIVLATSSAVLCASTAAGCGALNDAPISNAKANDNPAIDRVNAYEGVQQQAASQDKAANQGSAEKKVAQQAEASRKKSEAEAKKAKSDPVGTRNDAKPEASASGRPAWVIAINWASTKLGTKYVWGGESEEEGGFDCSGLMQAAYAKAGIELPRVANDQYLTTKIHPSEKNLRMGDLVFFGRSARGIHHVGIYIGRDENRNPMMLHAPNRRSLIRIDKVHYMSDYYGATRVIR